jgi:hypothetical protein
MAMAIVLGALCSIFTKVLATSGDLSKELGSA